MVDVTPPTPPSAPLSKRSRGTSSINELRPSPAIVSWIDRAVQRITSDPPWTYQADSPAASRVDIQHSPEPEGFAPQTESSQPQVPSQATSTSRSASLDIRSVPEDVRERFVRMGRSYYFSGGNVAFEDKGKKVVTRSENTEVVRSLVEIAQARGWKDITVSGTERFRREAWRQATYVGLIVRGYQPTELDKRQFVRDLAKARAPQELHEPMIDPPRPVPAPPYQEMPAPAAAVREVAPPTAHQARMHFEGDANLERERSAIASDRRGVRAHRADPTLAASSPAPGDARNEAINDARKGARGRSQRSRVYAGRLIEHGEARYKFSDDNEPSYYVRLETAGGTKDLWGVDFPRALNQAGVKEGDLIEVELTGRKSVAVKRPARDAQGRVLGEEEVSAHRNDWDVRAKGHGSNGSNGTSQAARSQPLHEPAASARQSARDNSALTNALATLRAAELLAEAQIPDVTQRTKFVEGVRAQLAQVLDNEAMPAAPQLRERAAERARTPARVLS